MNTIDVPGVRSFDQFQQNNAPNRTGDEELGKTAFLELMIAQISNQDPLEPAKNEAFIAQLAQFSSVEGIQNLNESMDSLVSSLRSSVTMDAAALVGRNVLIETNQTALNTRGGIGGAIDVSERVSDLEIEIMNQSGQVVHRQSLGEQEAGSTRFNWDGLDANGTQVEQGFFQVSAFGNVGGLRQQLSTNLPDQVVSVSIADGGLIANLAGGASVPAALIKEIQ